MMGFLWRGRDVPPAAKGRKSTWSLPLLVRLENGDVRFGQAVLNRDGSVHSWFVNSDGFHNSKSCSENVIGSKVVEWCRAPDAEYVVQIIDRVLPKRTPNQAGEKPLQSQA